ncbi:MAG: tetratricopeptide repeat protein [Bacteroidota bacterium]
MKKIFFIILVSVIAHVNAQQSDSLTIYMKAGNAKYQAKNYAGALKDFSNAIRLSPKNDEAYKMRGTVNYFFEKYPDAHADFNQSLELNPDCSDCIFYLSKVHEKLGETGESIKKMDELSDKIAYSSAMQYVVSGNKQLDYNNFKEAETEYDKAIAIYPYIAEAFYQKGYIRLQEGKNNEAIVQFDKALKIDSTYYLAYALKGSAYFLLNKFEEAVKNYTKSIKFSPTYSYAYISRGNAYYNLSKTTDACADWKKAKELGSKDVDTQLNTLCK